MYQVRELAEKEGEGGVFQVLRQDVTRFLTTILIGTTYGLLHFVLEFVLLLGFRQSEVIFSVIFAQVSDTFFSGMCRSIMLILL